MRLFEKLRNKAAAIGETMKFDNRWQLLVEELTSGRTLRVYRLGAIEAGPTTPPAITSAASAAHSPATNTADF